MKTTDEFTITDLLNYPLPQCKKGKRCTPEMIHEDLSTVFHSAHNECFGNDDERMYFRSGVLYTLVHHVLVVFHGIREDAILTPKIIMEHARTLGWDSDWTDWNLVRVEHTIRWLEAVGFLTFQGNHLIIDLSPFSEPHRDAPVNVRLVLPKTQLPAELQAADRLMLKQMGIIW